ncbi:MAG: transglutaminase family protein [Okeania sp. SIO3H1]|uniref:transglutaminase-like domain-containing protein n=1 Tax=Okeania sp. SIO1I7 TaxID=2607772 RepID=UPI0013CD8CC7|nr:transglutaminase family protein [Okeania sp. SIO1I7]NEN87787.1 transglutaminase family protein [Okeania sp. SIO3H1]NET27582.1 transglutaminase family protein [Okeania sp. SIO1I7]
MKKFQLGCQLNYTIFQPTTFLFNVQVVNNNCQNIVQEQLQLNPFFARDEYISSSEKNRFIRVNAPIGKLEISYQATVELSYYYGNYHQIYEVPLAELPLETLAYLYPSRYCQSDLLFGLAQSEFGNLNPGYSRVMMICDWIYDKVKYLFGSTNSQTSAFDTATERAGVCRDFAHLGIAFCRTLNIPARFVSAYAYNLNPPDFHACFEAYLGDRWYLFDPTKLVPLENIIKISTGRDAADVSFATLFGTVEINNQYLFVEDISDVQENKEVDESEAIAIS